MATGFYSQPMKRFLADWARMMDDQRFFLGGPGVEYTEFAFSSLDFSGLLLFSEYLRERGRVDELTVRLLRERAERGRGGE